MTKYTLEFKSTPRLILLWGLATFLIFCSGFLICLNSEYNKNTVVYIETDDDGYILSMDVVTKGSVPFQDEKDTISELMVSNADNLVKLAYYNKDLVVSKDYGNSPFIKLMNMASNNDGTKKEGFSSYTSEQLDYAVEMYKTDYDFLLLYETLRKNEKDIENAFDLLLNQSDYNKEEDKVFMEYWKKYIYLQTLAYFPDVVIEDGKYNYTTSEGYLEALKSRLKEFGEAQQAYHDSKK